jgi:hypothetical protein
LRLSPGRAERQPAELWAASGAATGRDAAVEAMPAGVLDFCERRAAQRGTGERAGELLEHVFVGSAPKAGQDAEVRRLKRFAGGRCASAEGRCRTRHRPDRALPGGGNDILSHQQ